MAAKTTSFSWLHLTDLHCGMKGQSWRWPNVRETVFDGLKKLHDKCGSWDLVLFTGDLTQKGNKDEFDRVDEILRELWDKFKELGFCPEFLAIPGNHDLVRPSDEDKEKPAVKLLLQWENQLDIHGQFWDNPNSDYRQVVTTAFKNYTDWWEKQLFKPAQINQGILPGDFSSMVR